MSTSTVSDEQVERAVRKVLAEVLPAALAGASVGIMRAIRAEFGTPDGDIDVDTAVRTELDLHGARMIDVVTAAMSVPSHDVEDVDG